MPCRLIAFSASCGATDRVDKAASPEDSAYRASFSDAGGSSALVGRRGRSARARHPALNQPIKPPVLQAITTSGKYR
jgi:hypothetical protein